MSQAIGVSSFGFTVMSENELRVPEFEPLTDVLEFRA
jgi:hypothetical protein